MGKTIKQLLACLLALLLVFALSACHPRSAFSQFFDRLQQPEATSPQETDTGEEDASL